MDFWTLPPNMKGYEEWLPKKFTPGEKSDPKIIGADDNCVYELRKPDELKDTPPVLVDVEVRELLPLAKLLGQYIGITAMQEAQYGNVLEQIRQRSVFVVLNVLRAKFQDGVAGYTGLIVMCKRHPIVRVNCKVHLATGRFGVANVHLWNKENAEYHIHGDVEGRVPMQASQVVPLIMEYLQNYEGVLPR